MEVKSRKVTSRHEKYGFVTNQPAISLNIKLKHFDNTTFIAHHTMLLNAALI